MNDYTIIKDHIRKYGGHFAKIIKINKVKYILMYFKNEQDLFKATYDSVMNEDLGKGLQIKRQDEIIGKDGNEEQFVDASTSPKVSTVPSNEVVKKFNQLNLKFSNHINMISGKKDSISKVKVQERRDDSDSE
ncbi:hypothetical protein RhiirB3_453508 [Rhizophagus irregularis]|nr:hypothetical protein RhiirB3_453508 [Rhizophagus irregularis]